MADEQTINDALDMITTPDPLLIEGVSEEERRSLEDIQTFVTGSNIVGLGIGEKITGGRVHAELALKFYVRKKLPSGQVTNQELIPAEISLPTFGTPVQTDVEEIGEMRLESYTNKVRPAMPGYSVAEAHSETGTLGCLVRKRGNPNDLFILSNAHILADFGLAHAGDTVTQPGSDDGGAVLNDGIAILAEFVAFNFEPAYTNLCDAAIARIQIPGVATSYIAELGVPTGVNTNLERGTMVQKTGRSTGHTTGIVKDVHYRTNTLVYPKPGGGEGRVWFLDQVLCERFTAPGDSGALVCDMHARAIGLHWAGSSTISAFHKIQNVLDALNIDLVTEEV